MLRSQEDRPVPTEPMTRYLVQRDCRLEGFEIRNPEQVRGEFKVTVDGTDMGVGACCNDRGYLSAGIYMARDRRYGEQFEPYTALIQWKCVLTAQE